MDEDQAEGVERGMLVFFAGHGEPARWWPRGGRSVSLEDTSVGDLDARYLWMDSCSILQHGGLDGRFPHQFDPKSMAGKELKNVFLRWGGAGDLQDSSPLNARLRMACGGSSPIVVGGHQVAQIWNNYLLRHLPVSDSFLLATAESGGVPLCIARGGSAAEETALITDQRFVDEVPRDSGLPSDAVHIQYPARCGSAGQFLENLGHALKSTTLVHVVQLAGAGAKSNYQEDAGVVGASGKAFATGWPVLVVSALDLPAPFVTDGDVEGDSFGFETFEAGAGSLLQLSPPLIELALDSMQTLAVLRGKESGAVLARWKASVESGASGASEAIGYPALLVASLTKQLGYGEPLYLGNVKYVYGPSFKAASTSEMRLDRVGAGNLLSEDPADYKCARSGYDLVAPLFIWRGKEALPIFGDGGSMRLRFSPGAESGLGSLCEVKSTFETDCENIGPPAFNLVLPRWRVKEVENVQAPKGWRSEQSLKAVVMSRLKSAASSVGTEPRIGDGQPGYLFPPLNCEPEDGRVYPVYRFQVEFSGRPGSSMTTYVPAVTGLDSIESTWRCSSPAEETIGKPSSGRE